MNPGLAEKTVTLRMSVVGADYITSLGLSELLGRNNSVEMLSSAANAEELLELMDTEPLDLVLVDASMKIAAVREICTRLINLPEPPTVVVLGDLPFDVAESLIFKGVSAILHLGVLGEDLPVALRMIHRGGALIVSDNARDKLMERSNTLDINHRARYNTLNARERTVAKGVSEGLTNVQLAASMHLSEASIKLLISNVMNKMSVCNRVQIAVVTIKAGAS